MTATRPSLLTAALAAGLLAAACERGPELDTRTFQLDHLDLNEARRIIEPYVYGDRPEGPGTSSGTAGVLTVRETPDNLEKIARVLEEYDIPSPFVRLRFQLIRADGVGETDPAIEEVVTELRKLFQYQGYELLGEAVMTAREHSRVGQQLAGAEQPYGLQLEIGAVRSNVIRLQEVTLVSERGSGGFRTSVNVSPGQTLVLGSSRTEDGAGAAILTVRAELVEP